jgi:succinate dehydrogenase/fumarate reductase cytochrome b subunit
MDTFLRVVAIIFEVVVLGAVFYYILNGLRLMLFDLGVKRDYSKIITVSLIVMGCIIITFLVSHLSTFYPGV